MTTFASIEEYGDKSICTVRFHFSNMKLSGFVGQDAQKPRMYRGSKTAERQNADAEEKH